MNCVAIRITLTLITTFGKTTRSVFVATLHPTSVQEAPLKAAKGAVTYSQHEPLIFHIKPGRYSLHRGIIVLSRRLVVPFFAIAVTAIAACSSSNGGVACPQVLLAPPQLFAPAPGSTGVPANVGMIIVGSPVDGTFSLQSPGGPAVPIGPVGPAPSPLPTGVPTSIPASSYHAIPVPTLSPTTTYAIRYQAPPGAPPCGSDESSGVIGSFTTF